MTGNPCRSASSIACHALRYPSGFGIPKRRLARSSMSPPFCWPTSTTVRSPTLPRPATLAPSAAEPRLAGQLNPVAGQPLDVVGRVGRVVVAAQLALAPDLLVGGLPADPGDLPLEPLELAGDAGAPEQRQVPQPPEPLAQPQLVLSRRH